MAHPWRAESFQASDVCNALIIGRLTYLSQPGPLPGRYSIVLSRSFTSQTAGVLSARSLDEALSLASELPGSEITVGGGQEIYKLFLPLANRIHLTVLDATFGGDRFFPLLPEDEFSVSSSERIEGPLPYTRFIYERSSGLPN